MNAKYVVGIEAGPGTRSAAVCERASATHTHTLNVSLSCVPGDTRVKLTLT